GFVQAFKGFHRFQFDPSGALAESARTWLRHSARRPSDEPGPGRGGRSRVIPCVSRWVDLAPRLWLPVAAVRSAEGEMSCHGSVGRGRTRTHRRTSRAPYAHIPGNASFGTDRLRV